MVYSKEEQWKQGLKGGIPIGLGYLSVSFSFGVMAVNMGLPPWAAVVISLVNVTSAGQFAGINLIVAGAPMVEMMLTQVVVNLRYSLMSLSLSQKADESMTTLHRMLISFFITDEIFGVTAGRSQPANRWYMYGLGLIPLVSWTLGTWLGVVAGGLLLPALRSALNVALYAMFIAIITPVAKSRRPVLLAVALAAALSLLFRYLPVFARLSPGFAMILSAVLAAFFCAWKYPIEEETHGDA